MYMPRFVSRLTILALALSPAIACASPPAFEGYAFIETPGASETYSGCRSVAFSANRQGTVHAVILECSEVSTAGQYPKWEPNPHPDPNGIQLFETRIRIDLPSHSVVYTECQLQDYAVDGEMLFTGLDCIDMPAAPVLEKR